ncbi:hypothetical protein CEXT_647031 [Caerostris extrusa]|uniref:Uncharacterized protein n=1 Tax=Caerostris extrusa TaxID=172846 RepID=A0AAV4VQV3_CAEEX|nr:hypothetical protein CEXT_647031 [Caerostris extrusa]
MKYIYLTLNLSEFRQNKNPPSTRIPHHSRPLTKWTFVSARDGQPFDRFFPGWTDDRWHRADEIVHTSQCSGADIPFGRLVFRLPHTPTVKTDGPTTK